MIHTVLDKKQEIRIPKQPDQKVLVNSVTSVDKKSAVIVTIEYEVVQ